MVWFYGAKCHFQQYFSYIVVVRFIDGENRLIMLVVIGTDCIGSYKFNYHTITTTMAPKKKWEITL